MANITSSPARQRDQRPGGVTGRDAYIAAQALIYAIEAIGELPDWRQEKSNARDMQRLLEYLAPNPQQRQHMTKSVRWHLFEASEHEFSA